MVSPPQSQTCFNCLGEKIATTLAWYAVFQNSSNICKHWLSESSSPWHRIEYKPSITKQLFRTTRCPGSHQCEARTMGWLLRMWAWSLKEAQANYQTNFRTSRQKTAKELLRLVGVELKRHLLLGAAVMFQQHLTGWQPPHSHLSKTCG